MRKFQLISLMWLLPALLYSQKVPVRVDQGSQAASSTWFILDEIDQTVYSGQNLQDSGFVEFSLESEKRYFLRVSVFEVNQPDSLLYRLSIAGEPVLRINCPVQTGEYLFPFFTGIRNRQTKITGGTTASISDFPWQVYFIAGSYRCGGSIIGGRWVITAAHCTKNDFGTAIPVNTMSVKVGTNNPSSSIDGKLYSVSEVIVHEGYDHQTLENDIALLHLKDSIDYSNAAPIKLLSSINSAEGYDEPGVMAWITGYGLIRVNPDVLPNSLQKVQLPIISNAQASTVWSDIPTTDLMAGYKDGNKDACSGDSGGPLVVPVLGEYKLAGIVSWGSTNCNTYGAYTRVALFENWVTSKTGIPVQFMPPPPVGDTIVCQGTTSSQFSITATPTATSYEWRLYPADAGSITGNSAGASVTWNVAMLGKVSVMYRISVNNVLSDWSFIDVNIVKNTRLISFSGDTTLCAEQPVTLSVAAEGYKLIYKWYRDNTLVQSGSSGSLVYPKASAANSGTYHCEVSGACGTVVAKGIDLTVYPLTDITYITPDVDVLLGESYDLKVNAVGHDLTYQWKKDGQNLAGATSDNYPLNRVNATDIGLYQAVVSGTCGIKVSDSIWVYVGNENRPGAVDVLVWPTVTEGLFNVAMSSNNGYTISIYSTSGRLIREKNNCRFQEEMYIGDLPKGVYLVYVKSGSFRRAFRVIKI